MALELARAMFNNVDAGVPDEQRANDIDPAAALRHMRCGCRDAAVTDEHSFLDFLTVLAADWQTERDLEASVPSLPYSAGALGWENGSIGMFLDAACEWGAASADGLPFYTPPNNPWRRAADILMAGKFYE